ncbi:MAG TPA: ABC transporter substrate-binding protein [Spongiibacteraceae bacterium]
MLKNPLFRLIFCLLFALSGNARAESAIPQRIASLNLCTDQLLLMLVPRERIVSVTDWAARPESSYMAAAAQGIPINHGLVEAVLPQKPDLILAGEYTDPTLLNLLRRLGYRVETTAVPHDLPQARAHILHFGELVGASLAAQQIVADMDRRLQLLDARQRARKPQLAAAYAPNGMTVGRGAVLAEIIERAGWRNLGSELNMRGYAQLSLEQLLLAQPRLLVLDVTAENKGGSIAYSYLSHPALATLARNARVVTLPPALSECIGPMTVDAIELLAAQR